MKPIKEHWDEAPLELSSTKGGRQTMAQPKLTRAQAEAMMHERAKQQADAAKPNEADREAS